MIDAARHLSPDGRLRRRSLRVLGALVLAASMLACGGGDEPGEGAPVQGAPDRGSGDGATLYADNCASCHGADLRGTEQGPSHLSVVYEPNHHTDDVFRSAVRNGAPGHHWAFGDMPPVEGLDDAEIDAIIAFVREAQAREGFEPYPP